MSSQLVPTWHGCSDLSRPGELSSTTRVGRITEAVVGLCLETSPSLIGNSSGPG